MANNRMWLKNKRTGAQVLLAKYYPSTGWYSYHDDIGDRIDRIFAENAPAPTMLGDNEWVLEYEQAADEGCHIADVTDLA